LGKYNDDLETILRRHLEFELTSRGKTTAMIMEMMLSDTEDRSPSEIHQRLRVLQLLQPTFERPQLVDDIQIGGNWFLDSTEYKEWVATPGTTLFTPGIPGSGKSTMMSIVLRDLRKRLGPDARFACVRFDPELCAQVEEGHALPSIIADLARLLCSGHTDAGNSLPTSVVRLLEDMETLRSMATLGDLSKILQALGAPTTRVFLLFDAVEVASEILRSTLMTDLQHLQSSLGFNIFATALLGSGIDKLFQPRISLEIRAEDSDIRRYMGDVLSNIRLQGVPVGVAGDAELRNRIVSTTVDKSDGMLVNPCPSN
jgi:hypothetical protein